MTIPLTRKVFNRIIQLVDNHANPDDIFVKVNDEFMREQSPFDKFSYDPHAFIAIGEREAYILGFLAARLAIRGGNHFSLKSPMRDQPVIEDLVDLMGASKDFSYTKEKHVRVAFAFTSDEFHELLKSLNLYNFRAGKGPVNIPQEYKMAFYQAIITHGGKIRMYQDKDGKHFSLILFANIGFNEHTFRFILEELSSLLDEDIDDYKILYSDKGNRPRIEIDGEIANKIIAEVYAEPYGHVPEHIINHIESSAVPAL